MNEREFIQTLQFRANEQEKILRGMLFPKVFSFVSFWLGEHPWRFLIPLAFVLSLIFHLGLGRSYDDVILKIFGGFGLIHFK